MKNIIALFSFILITIVANSQNQNNKPLDSLKILSTSQIGKEKFNTFLNIARIYAGINLDSSKIYTNRAFKISEALNNDSLKIKALLALGFSSFESGEYTNAIKNFEKALPISSLIKDSTSIADIYNGFAISYSKTGDLNKSIEYNFKTLSIYEKLKDSLGMGNSYLNIGWDYRSLKEFNKSLKYNLLSLEIYTKINNSLRIAMANNNIAGTQNELGNYNEAIEYSKKSKNYFLELNYKRFTAYPISVMAVAYDSLHNYQLAEKNYLEAVQLHTENREPYELTFLNYSIANLYYKQGKYDQALVKAKEAFTLANEINAKDYIAETSEILSKIYEKQNKLKLSNSYLRIFITYKDSILNDEKIKSIAEIETKYETEKKEKEIAQQKEELLKNELEIKNKNLTAILLGSGLLFFSIISFGLYKRQQHKKRAYKNKLALKEAQTYSKLQDQRLRISRDLHDNIGSQLTFIISSIDNLKFLTDATNEKLKNKLSEINQFASATIGQLRDTIWAMNKNEITFEEFQSRLLAFIEKAKAATNQIHFNFNATIKSDISFSSIKGMNIFRVFQEAINNAIKYAEASEINMLISENEATIKFEITDNGKGFDINTTELGNGLENMQRRINEVGGSISINSELKKGTSIKINCPKNKTNAV